MSDCLWIHSARPRPHWYGLTEPERRERQAAWKDVAEASIKAGGACHGRYHVRGQHDFETVETWTFADAEAAFRHWAALCAAQYNEYNAFANNIGLAIEAPR